MGFVAWGHRRIAELPARRFSGGRRPPADFEEGRVIRHAVLALGRTPLYRYAVVLYATPLHLFSKSSKLFPIFCFSFRLFVLFALSDPKDSIATFKAGGQVLATFRSAWQRAIQMYFPNVFPAVLQPVSAKRSERLRSWRMEFDNSLK